MIPLIMNLIISHLWFLLLFRNEEYHFPVVNLVYLPHIEIWWALLKCVEYSFILFYLFFKWVCLTIVHDLRSFYVRLIKFPAFFLRLRKVKHQILRKKNCAFNWKYLLGFSLFNQISSYFFFSWWFLEKFQTCCLLRILISLMPS